MIPTQTTVPKQLISKRKYKKNTQNRNIMKYTTKKQQQQLKEEQTANLTSEIT